MFRSFIIGIGTVALTVVAAPPASAWSANLLSFQLANEAGYALTEIYVSPSLEDGWGGDLLGPAPLPSGAAREIALSGRDGTCHYDIRFVGDDGSLIEDVAVDLCTIGRYTLEP